MKIKNIKLILLVLTGIILQTGCINKNENLIDNNKFTPNKNHAQATAAIKTTLIKHTETTSSITSIENLLSSTNSHISEYTTDTSTISPKLTKCAPFYNTEISTEIINPDIFTTSTKTINSNLDNNKITLINNDSNSTIRTETLTIPVSMPENLITESEKILLCNLVGREYGSDYHGNTDIPVTLYERGQVVAVVMNRVNSSDFPDNIYDVITQPEQFSGYLSSDIYSYQVTQNVIDSVDYYFEHTEEYSPDILYFEGDGSYNYFH